MGLCESRGSAAFIGHTSIKGRQAVSQGTPFWTAARKVPEPSSVSKCAALWLCWGTWGLCRALCFLAHLKGNSLPTAPPLLKSLQLIHIKAHKETHIHTISSLLFSYLRTSTFEKSPWLCVWAHTSTCTYLNPCFFQADDCVSPSASVANQAPGMS